MGKQKNFKRSFERLKSKCKVPTWLFPIDYEKFMKSYYQNAEYWQERANIDNGVEEEIREITKDLADFCRGKPGEDNFFIRELDLKVVGNDYISLKEENLP